MSPAGGLAVYHITHTTHTHISQQKQQPRQTNNSFELTRRQCEYTAVRVLFACRFLAIPWHWFKNKTNTGARVIAIAVSASVAKIKMESTNKRATKCERRETFSRRKKNGGIEPGTIANIYSHNVYSVRLEAKYTNWYSTKTLFVCEMILFSRAHLCVECVIWRTKQSTRERSRNSHVRLIDGQFPLKLSWDQEKIHGATLHWPRPRNVGTLNTRIT